ncbi:MAG: hypothetical protein ABR912_14605 [Terracidiphilus sp.]|jgi:uracil-DNA glycosylase
MGINDPSSDEQNVENFVQMAKESLGEDLLKQPGAVLYSSWKTLKGAEYYFLGVNPAGSGEAEPKQIRQSLDELSTSTVNAYLDENWSGTRKYGIGGHPLQQNYKFLFSELGEKLDAICASNLIFKSNKKEKDAGGRPMAKKYWPVHEAIIRKIVKPRVIITFGRLPFDFIKEKLHGDYHQPEKTKHGKWTWRYSILETGEKLIGLPHLSRYALRKDPGVVNRIKEIIG